MTMEGSGLRTFLLCRGQRSRRVNSGAILDLLVDYIHGLTSLASEQLHVLENATAEAWQPRADPAPRPRESDERGSEVHCRHHLLFGALRVEPPDVAHRGGSEREQEGNETVDSVSSGRDVR